MKHTLLLILFIFCVAGNAVLAQGSMKISGRITGQTADSITVNYNGSKLIYDNKQYTAKLDKDGNFEMKIPTPDEEYTEAKIKYTNRETDLIISNGFDLMISAEGKKFDTSLRYKGKGSEIENLLAKHALEMGRMNGFPVKLKPFMAYDSVMFPKAVAQERKHESEFFEKNKKDIPAAFAGYWENYYKYYSYYFLMQYPIIHEMTKNKTTNVANIPRGNYMAMHRVPYDFNDSFINIAPYLLYVNIVFPSKLNAAGYTYAAGDSVKQIKTEDSVRALAGKHLPEKTASYFFAQDLYTRARNQPVTRSKKQLAFYKNHFGKNEYLPLLENQVATAERLQPGMPAPDFDITTETGMKMKLSDLKGHVVYLTFWSTFCKPCVGEMINEKKMKDLYKDKPVSFLYVNINDDTLAKKILDHYHINGIFTNVKGEWYSPEAKAYGVQGLPTYYLIDEEGKIALQKTPTPREETELILAIGRLLK